jgi:DNA mismatch endonuclease (patch repair protein)
MQANRQRDTKPEIALRSALHRRGLRFFAHRRIDNCSVDVVFPRLRIAIFVDGCFWHGCPVHYRPSRRNAAFWTAKVARNQERDRLTDDHLQRSGWLVIRTWEHEDISEAVDRIAKAVMLKRQFN